MAPSAQQYFSRDPSAPDRRQQIEVSLRGVPARVTTSTGVFSEHRLDPGTAVLLRKAPQAPAAGTFLDLGCGWGPIALALATESPQAQVWAVDINARAVDLCALNAKNLGRMNLHAVLDTDLDPSLRFDLIWSNPPIRVGKEALHALLLQYLPRLNPGGRAVLVVQKNLGADSLAAWLTDALGDGFAVSRIASSKGYRLLDVHRLMTTGTDVEQGTNVEQDLPPQGAGTSTGQDLPMSVTDISKDGSPAASDPASAWSASQR